MHECFPRHEVRRNDKTYVFGHEVHVIVPDLKVQPQDPGELGEIRPILAEELHQTYRQHEQSSSL